MQHLQKLSCKGTLRQVFICLRPPLLLSFCLGRSSNFVGSEYGQIQSVKLQNIVTNRSQHPPPPPSNTFSGWGQKFTKLSRKYQHDCLYLQSKNSDKHLPRSPFTGQFLQMSTFCFAVHTVNQSMGHSLFSYSLVAVIECSDGYVDVFCTVCSLLTPLLLYLKQC